MSVNMYGDLPGVTAEVIGGSIAQVNVGYEQICVLFGRGDDSAGNASFDEPKQVQTAIEARDEFGDDTQLAHACEKALANGVNSEYLYGVMPTETDVSAEAITGGSGTLANSPIVEDASTISITNTTQSQSATPVFRYESSPDTSGLDGDEVALNPLTGEFDSGDADDYEIDYAWLDWSAALDAADTVVGHNEFGVYCTLTDAASVAATLSTKLDELRPTYKLIRGLTGAQPNSTTSDGAPELDTSSYTDSLDNDALFVAGPVRLSGVGSDADGYDAAYGKPFDGSDGPYGWTVLGGLAGLFAGNDITNPVYGDAIDGYGSLIQSLSISEEGDPIDADGSGGSGLRGEQVMPVRDSARDGAGGLTIEDSLSTSTATDYPRDYHRRRIIDQVLISGREIGETLRGRRVTDPILSDTEETVVDVFEEMVDDGLLETNTDSVTPNQNPSGQDRLYGATLTQTDVDTYALELYFRPINVAKNIEETLVVDSRTA